MMRDTPSPESLLLKISELMPERVEPQCRHFGACGGCQLQHLPQPQQLAAKQTMLTDVLARSGITQLPIIHVHAAEPWQYRNRARMRIATDAEGLVQIGYSRRASNEFLAIEECPIVSPLLWKTATALRDTVRDGEAQAGVTLPAQTSSVEFFVNDDESAVQLSVQADATVATVDRDAPRDLRTLAGALQLRVPQLVGAGLSVAAVPDRTQSKRVQESQRMEIVRWGAPSLQCAVNGRSYTITRNAFFQVNRFLTSTMVNTVLDNRTGRVVYDLFAGAGLFSVPLSERFDAVTAVEIGEPAASDLAAHLAAGGTQHKAVRSTALAFLQTQARGTQPDLIVLDPPRAGLGLPAVRALIGAQPREIVYVSCDAGSFARDARPLIESGYTLTDLHLLDLFPQTFHTETIATFRR